MGARAAVLSVTPETEKLVLVSYPLAGGEERARILRDLREGVEVLFIVGARDGMCDLTALGKVRREMKCKSWLIVVRGADHGMNVKPAKKVGEVGEATGRAAAEWIKGHGVGSESEIWVDEGDGTVRQGEWRAAEAPDGAVKDDRETEGKPARAKKAPPKKGRSKASSEAKVTTQAAHQKQEAKTSSEAGVETRASKRRRKAG